MDEWKIEGLQEIIESYLGEKKKFLYLQIKTYSSGFSGINGFGARAIGLLEEIHRAEADLGLLESGKINEDYLGEIRARYSLRD